MILVRLSLILAATALAGLAQNASFSAAQNASVAERPPAKLPELAHFSASEADPRVNPCTDFYQYACAKWMAENPIPADQVQWDTAGPLQLWNETLLGQTLEKLSANNAQRTANEQKVGDYYFACMDTGAIEQHTREWLKPELDRIAALKSTRDLAVEIAHLHQTIPGAWAGNDNETNAALFGFAGGADYDDASRNVAQIDQGGMGLPARSFYLDQDEKSKQIREKYVRHIERMLVLGGEPQAQAKADAAVVLEIETALAKGAMDAVHRRDPKNLNNQMSLAQVKALTPSFDWDRYLSLVHAPPSTPHYLVSAPEFFRNLETVLRAQPLDHWKAYLRWQMLHGSANALSQAFVNENFDFFTHTLYGAEKLQPRWRRCVSAVDALLGEALGQVYVARAFSPESKTRVLQMVRDIEAEMSKDIQAQNWMAAETKRRAVEKLNAVVNKIGYPDHWRDYSSVHIGRTSYLANRQAGTAFEFERWVAKIGKPVDRTEWQMTPPTVNAYEDPQTNTINFPAGILQPPLFGAQDDGVNYGAAGQIIGHELIHSFDDQGRKFDAKGNLRDWWQAADAAAYDKRGACIANEYSQMIPEAGVKQDGKLTQGEDTADNGGLHLAFLAYQDALARQGKKMDVKESDGLTPRQRFFEAFAFEWCSNVRPELMRTQVLTNPHSLPKYRVNNVVSNMPEFWQAFSCHKGQPMVRENACRVW
ncbi:MAG TPA: M13 family metallopeptidase [Bryobacteraceae bacterium]|nr:M13 family metallopeptidase [Bryobacteraceae bacterium]